MKKCTHKPRHYHAPEDIFGAGFDNKSNILYRCMVCGRYIYQPQPWQNWQLAPERFQDYKGVA